MHQTFLLNLISIIYYCTQILRNSCIITMSISLFSQLSCPPPPSHSLTTRYIKYIMLIMRWSRQSTIAIDYEMLLVLCSQSCCLCAYEIVSVENYDDEEDVEALLCEMPKRNDHHSASHHHQQAATPRVEWQAKTIKLVNIKATQDQRGDRSITKYLWSLVSIRELRRIQNHALNLMDSNVKNLEKILNTKCICFTNNDGDEQWSSFYFTSLTIDK